MNLNNSSPHRKPVKKKTTIRNSSISNQKTPIFNQSINLQREYNEWNNTFERLVNMMSIVVSKPTIPLDTNSNKRLFLEEMCSTVCKKANNSTPKKNNGVSNKIKRYQSIIRQLQNKIHELENENQINQNKLEEILHQQRSQIENSVLEDKINRVEELLLEQVKKKTKSTNQKVKERPSFRNTFIEDDKTELQPQDIFNPSFSIQDDFNPKTTKAISKYRQRVRRQEAMKGKVRNVIPYPEISRKITPEEPMSQEYIHDTLKKLPYSIKDRNHIYSEYRLSTQNHNS
ncbi:hypothetical protein M9Y10_021581 [Tritrichomonas musculus]|uniref:Uncharacterized protein n=1 Tax=Tritrichomonas musculus TaxID=1915356 RepID=A0ABR2KQZ0_9EUKA